MGRIIRVALVALVILSMAALSFAVSVTVSSPAPGSTVSSPVTFKASASSGYPITGWHIYVDNNSVYSAGMTQSISASVSMATGTHSVIVRAWDSTGAYGSANFQLSVSGTTSSGVSVNVSTPTNNSSVSSPMGLKASASSGQAITGWNVYVDGVSKYTAGAVTSIAPAISMSSGAHQVVVRAWNTSGAFGSSNLSVSVGGTTTGGGGPTPPSNATAFTNLDQQTGWGNCKSAGCSGSSAGATYWMAQFQTTPSLDGSSTHFYMNGSPWADVLWYKHVTPIPSAAHFLLDYMMWIGPEAATDAEALEFDFVQFVNGRRFDISNQCHYSGTPHWDTWDSAGYHWIHSSVPCPKFSPNTWHHIKIYAERTATQTHNISYTVDGVTYQVPTAYAWHNTAVTASSGYNSQNVQVQLDTNGHGGVVQHWIDKMTLYVW